jgi:two-component system, LytTR family, sensor kinase
VPLDLHCPASFVPIDKPFVPNNSPRGLTPVYTGKGNEFMQDSSNIEFASQRRRWLLIICCTSVVAIIYAARSVFISVSSGRPIDWTRQVGFEFLYWFVWASLTPIVLWIARHFPIERANWRRVVPILIGFGLVIAPLQSVVEVSIAYFIDAVIRHTPAAEMARRRQLIPRGIVVECFGNFIIYSLILCGHYAYAYYQKYREREMRSLELEGRLVQAQLQNLKMQLQPHFLFNTLHTISILMMRDVSAANSMLIRLSDLLRITLDSSGTQEVSLKEELDFLRGYLEIEQTRFQDRLEIRLDIAPVTLDALVPNLILQPLVENAIRHGIAGRTESGLIEIRARRIANQLCLEVSDNGVGLKQTPELNKGVGLTNTQARLKQLYGKTHLFELINVPSGGLSVKIIIPFKTSDQEK